MIGGKKYEGKTIFLPGLSKMSHSNMTKPGRHRAKIIDDLNGVLITIPSQKSILLPLILLVWTLACIFFGNLVSKDPDMEEVLFVIIGGGAFGGLFLFLMILRSFFGKESILITNSGLTISKTICGIGSKRKYNGHRIKNWRVRNPEILIKSVEMVNINLLYNGWIGFDYGIKSIYFGNDLGEAEAQFIKNLCVSKSFQAGDFQSNDMEDPDRGRVTISRNGEGTTISIPARHLYFTYLVFTFIMAISILEIISPPVDLEFLNTPNFRWFPAILLASGVAGVIYTFIHFRTRSSLRKDILYLYYDSLVVSRSFLGIRKDKTHKWDQITNWRIRERKPDKKSESIYLLAILSGWEVAFDYEGQTVSIGVGLRKSEAEYIMNLCKRRGAP